MNDQQRTEAMHIPATTPASLRSQQPAPERQDEGASGVVAEESGRMSRRQFVLALGMFEAAVLGSGVLVTPAHAATEGEIVRDFYNLVIGPAIAESELYKDDKRYFRCTTEDLYNLKMSNFKLGRKVNKNNYINSAISAIKRVSITGRATPIAYVLISIASSLAGRSGVFDYAEFNPDLKEFMREMLVATNHNTYSLIQRFKDKNLIHYLGIQAAKNFHQLPTKD